MNGPLLKSHNPVYYTIGVLKCFCIMLLASVVQTLDSAIHRINYYPADSVIVFRNTYPLDSDLSGG